MNIEPLMTAIAGDNAEEAVRLVKEQPALLQASCDELARTPLHVAARLNRRMVAEAVVKAGADFYAQDSNGQLPLDVQPGGESNDTLKFLRDINQERNKFLGAVTAGDVAEVNRALKADPTLAKSIDIGSGSTALLLACFKGNADVAKELLDNGADVTQLEWSTGTDALYWSIDSNSVTCATLLLEHGVDVERMWNVKYNELPMKMNALHYASWKGRAEIVDLLLKHKADPNVRAISYAMLTPLHMAASNAHADVVKLLLDAGADATALDGRRAITAAEMAKRVKNDEVVKVLADFAAAH